MYQFRISDFGFRISDLPEVAYFDLRSLYEGVGAG